MTLPDERLRELMDAAASALTAAADYRGVLSAVARAGVPSVARWSAVHVCEANDVRQLASAHADPELARVLRDIGRRWTVALDATSGIASALTRAAPLLVPEVGEGRAAATLGLQPDAGGALDDALRSVGVSSLAMAPLVIDERCSASITWARGPGTAPFDASDLALLTALAAYVAPVARFARHAAHEERGRGEAEAARQRITQVLDELHDGFLSLDAGWRITYLNDAVIRLWPLSRAGASSAPLWDMLPSRAARVLSAASERAMFDAATVDVELELDDGRWSGVRVVPTRDGLSLHVRDVTSKRLADAERERLLAAAEVARIAAEEANQAKSDFLATMSHELRTPLNAILGYVALMADGITGPLADAQRTQLERVRASALHLLALIEDVLSFARLEASTETMHLDMIDASSPAIEAAQLAEPVIEAHGLHFRIERSGHPIPVETDVRRVRQILLNLLSNAARFTPAGGTVTLTIARDEAMANFIVEDSGIGIAPEHLERIFEPFWQVQQTLTRRTGGTGLGLSVSRRLARLLGGDLVVESTLGTGSRFAVSIPLALR